ncbi:MAG: Rne/Rng family ribonuclease, partial [Pseudomonadota bacterium]
DGEEKDAAAPKPAPRRRSRRKKTKAAAEEASAEDARAEKTDASGDATVETETPQNADATNDEAAQEHKSDNVVADDNEDDGDNPEAADENAEDASGEEATANAATDVETDAEPDSAAEDDDDEGEKPKQASRKRRSKNNEREALFERYKEAKRKRSQLLRNYKIQEVIKRRQILLVQVVKEERGNKGAALTTYMSLAGRYCVLMPNTARGGGISRKIPQSTDRKRLRRVVDGLDVPQGMGLIIRTAGAKRTKIEIKRDYDYLLRLWENIRSLTLKSVAPCLIYEEANLIKRAIRDLYDKDIGEVQVEGETGYREAKDFMKMLMPSHAKHVQPYKAAAPVFLKYGVEAQLDGMYQPTVRLKSGGYIVIHQTEALVAIDVNSGRATRERNIEQTALKTNIEAAYEAARQFRLRDLAGLIVLDFIDMEEPKNNRKVEKALKDAIKNDRARIQVGRISSFGLLEMSRQRRRSGIVDGTTQICPTCNGAGAIRSSEMAALRILRAIEGEAVSGKVGVIAAHASLDVTVYILNHHRDWLRRIEGQHGVTIQIIPDTNRAGDDYALEKSGTPRESSESAPIIRADQTEMIEIDERDHEDLAASDDNTEDRPDGERKKRRRKRRRKDASADSEQSAANSDEDSENEARDAKNDLEDGDSEEDGPKRRRRRGRRGGRRNRRNRGDDQAAKDGGKSDEADSGGNDESSSSSDKKTGRAGEEHPSETENGAERSSDATDTVEATDNLSTPSGGGSSEDLHAADDGPGTASNGIAKQEEEPHASESAPEAKSADPEPSEPLDLADAPQPPVKKPRRKGWWSRGGAAE